MGQKVNPIGFRLGGIFSWNSTWFASKENYKKYLQQDITIRKFLKKHLQESAVAKIDIARTAKALTITIHSGKPGFIIGRGGQGIDDLKKLIKKKFFASEKVNLDINVVEVKNPDLSSELILQNIAQALEKRVPFKKVLRQSLFKAERAGAKGIKIVLSGRLNGVDIARSEKVTSGKIPLHTLRANIDYTRGVANTIFGVIGIKVWVYHGEVFNTKSEEAKNLLQGKK
jgi:small subunit ribosomal protein S3